MTEIHKIMHQSCKMMHQILPAFTSNPMTWYSVTWKWTCLREIRYKALGHKSCKLGEPNPHPNLTKLQRQTVFREWGGKHPHLTYKNIAKAGAYQRLPPCTWEVESCEWEASLAENSVSSKIISYEIRKKWRPHEQTKKIKDVCIWLEK